MSFPNYSFGERVWAGALAVPILCCGSCARNEGNVPVFPVRGQVVVGGKPAKNAFVVFHPAGAEGPQALRPYAHAGADGSFKLTTYALDDGAPAGEYLVTVVWLAPGGGEDPPDLLKGRYRDPAASPLRVTIPKESTELTPFKLTR
jgi:hypothetical protein